MLETDNLSHHSLH